VTEDEVSPAAGTSPRADRQGHGAFIDIGVVLIRIEGQTRREVRASTAAVESVRRSNRVRLHDCVSIATWATENCDARSSHSSAFVRAIGEAFLVIPSAMKPGRACPRQAR